MNVFKFHSIGQGLFYTGTLAHSTYNFVYDCGTESKKKYLYESIDSHIESLADTDKNPPSIDFVIISHVHKDHFNGLYHLLQKAKVKKLYLPYLGDNKDFITFVLANEIFKDYSNDEDTELDIVIFRLMLGLYGVDVGNFNNYETEIVFVGEDKNYNGNYGDFAYSQKEFLATVNNHNYWKFVLINKMLPLSKIEQLNTKLSQEMINRRVGSIIDLIGNNPQMIKTIHDIYKEIFGADLNITSTVLIHYPLYNEPIAFYITDDLKRYCQNNVRSHRYHSFYPINIMGYECAWLESNLSILTGDAMVDAKMGKLICSHLELRNGIFKCGVLQAPHHGSKDNWKAWKKLSIPSEVYVIPFGMGNKHKLPHADTIDDLLPKCRCTQLVNQMQEFEYYID